MSCGTGKIVIKGVQNVEDSKKLADLGVDGILLSNHGAPVGPRSGSLPPAPGSVSRSRQGHRSYGGYRHYERRGCGTRLLWAPSSR